MGMGSFMTVKEVKSLKLPDGMKQLMIEMLLRIKNLERDCLGSIELAYWRGKQEWEDEHPDK